MVHRLALPRLLVTLLIIVQLVAGIVPASDGVRTSLAQDAPTPEQVVTEEPAPPTPTSTPTDVLVEPTMVVDSSPTVEPTSAPSVEPTPSPPAPLPTETPTAMPTPSGTAEPGTVTPTPAPMPTPAVVVTSAETATPRLTISKNAGNVGNTLGISISGFPVLKRVAIYFDGARKVTLVTDAKGSASGSITVPAAVAGLHEIKANGSGKTAIKMFRIRPVLRIAPSSTQAGGAVTVTMTGFAGNSASKIRLYEIDGSSTVLSVWVATTDARGGVVKSFTTKRTLSGGKHIVTAMDASKNAASTSLSITARPAPPVPDDPTVSQIYSGGTSGRAEIALTFDAGSDRGYAEDILDILADYGIKATFGMTGLWAQENPDLIRRMVREGHQIINHTWSHPSFTGESTAGVALISRSARLKQLSDTEALIANLTGGYAMKPYFRPPYGDIDASVLVDVAAGGYTATIMWTCDSLGWNGLSASQIVARCGSNAERGDIILMHVGSDSQDAAALPTLIEVLLDDGFRLVTVEQLLQP